MGHIKDNLELSGTYKFKYKISTIQILNDPSNDIAFLTLKAFDPIEIRVKRHDAKSQTQLCSDGSQI